MVDVKGGTSSERRDCFNCGREDHLATDRKCPARGIKCDQCGEIGHFKLKCRKSLAKKYQRGWRNTSSASEKAERQTQIMLIVILKQNKSRYLTGE